MRRTLIAAPLVGAILLAALTLLRAGPSPAGNATTPSPAGPNPPAAALPLSHVVLFSSGVGYFQREGEIDGTARVDLTFPATDVNDLIKSLVLQDTGGGKVATINYDSQDPIERTLKTFALDLTANPSLGQLLNQARGEKVEVTLQQSSGGQGGTLTGSILGMESQRQPQGKDQAIDVDVLNLVCAEGLRSVKLTDVLRVRFLNPTLDAELHRALEVIAGGRDHQKKSVSLSFKGEGKRPVRVGYVVESPMWKTTYRLVLGSDGKAMLQGWGLVENTTDDDWTNVRMALVSGRPISFQMDLYQPLYVPRPMVEPERFASLRPPTYGGAMTNPAQAGEQGQVPPLGAGQNPGALGFAGGNNQTNLGMQGGVIIMNGGMPFNRYQLGGQLGNPGGQWGFQAGNTGNGQFLPAGQVNDFSPRNFISGLTPNNDNFANNRLTFEQLQQRKQELRDNKEKAKKVGTALAMLDASQSVASVASAEDIGDVCHYVIDEKVTLPRQKSAMLPIVHQAVDATKVSIFNESVHAKFPLLGLRFRNTAAQPLMQGPITVYDGTAYAGDSRVQDLQPGEERLLSYALDTGTEVKVEGHDDTDRLDAVKVVKGVMHATHKLRQTRSYLIKNRSGQDRTLLVEHPVREDWRLVTPEKPAERSRDVYRFQVTVPAGQPYKLDVVEEQRRTDHIRLSGTDGTSVRVFLQSKVPSPALKAALEKLLGLKVKLADTQRELGQAQEQLKGITDDQTRIRANLEKVPPTSAAYKRYLEKFDQQETEIEKLQAVIKAKQEGVKAQTKEYEDYVMGMNVEA
ncbi:MAG TPA: DUF4139 domain-containing protein [Gemmataceae bacterium]|jgi:hypothetical protein